MQKFSLFLWQAADSGAAGWTNLLFLFGAIIIIYFLMIRPQQQERKKQKGFFESLKKGQKVVTMGGVHGSIANITESTIELIIAPKTMITIQREAVSKDMTQAVYGDEDAKDAK
ncbi:preprotein translocase, YajC subunit [Saprospira grandis DSM 2844]|uniref:Sec translocon accessory complex subunit YajC n=1 Tax=Saprospira grandis DSM 2844 TaxID=694433 RepID=J0NWI8_9BACT|nr:preprotein translocase subunit YajC [Saprospira grandis]EJF51869.1 preprotein translocase, YajC subunit [Saprospira grandis DSM 2844]